MDRDQQPPDIKNDVPEPDQDHGEGILTGLMELSLFLTLFCACLYSFSNASSGMSVFRES